MQEAAKTSRVEGCTMTKPRRNNFFPSTDPTQQEKLLSNYTLRKVAMFTEIFLLSSQQQLLYY
jgi:hypothetical protein